MSRKKVTRLTEQQVWQNIDRLIDICSKYGWEVEYDLTPKVRNRGLADSENRKITLNASQRAEHIYYVFIHEVGHMIGRLWHYDWDKKYAVLLDSSKKNTATYKIARIQDEIEAWDIGLDFVRRRKFKINQQKYDKIRAECLTSYMLWATKRKTNAKWNKLSRDEDIIIPADCTVNTNNSDTTINPKEVE